ncbi:NAD(P)-dependent alcohol dehydrogenase [Streptomyces sp. NPDC005474]|uniref:NAD(P)-dependent alcohol dehydrogenase n=1 Tax=Streptomyces sp. NPDC005474 TaxID=3154878 RepID=UPI0034531EF3
MRMTAAVLRSADVRFRVEEVELNTRLRADEVLVRIAGCGMCHTDLAVRHSGGRSALPAVLGHEGSGTIVETGAEVTDMAVGDNVVLSFDSCGQCRTCLLAAPAHCESFAALNLFGERTDDNGRFTDSEGHSLAPRWFGQSSFAQYAVVRARTAVRVDPVLPVELLGPLGCGFLTGAGAALSTFGLAPGDTFVVAGAGGVGLAAVMAARAAGATVVAVDRSESRLGLAEQFGATTVHSSEPDLGKRLREHTDGGPQYALDTTGAPVLINSLLQTLRPTGTLGVVARQRAVLDLWPGGLLQGRSITHICEGDSVPRLMVPRLIGLWREGRFPFDQLIKTYPLSAIDEAERDCLSGEVVKPVLLPPSDE